LQRAKNPNSFVLVESAVLFEAGQHKRFDKMIVAWCRPEQQVERYRARTGLSEEAIRARMAAQMSNDEKKRMADFVIDTSVSLPDTERQVKEVFSKLQALASQPTRASF
jgi:dephospho-CoA kinase